MKKSLVILLLCLPLVAQEPKASTAAKNTPKTCEELKCNCAYFPFKPPECTKCCVKTEGILMAISTTKVTLKVDGRNQDFTLDQTPVKGELTVGDKVVVTQSQSDVKTKRATFVTELGAASPAKFFSPLSIKK